MIYEITVNGKTVDKTGDKSLAGKLYDMYRRMTVKEGGGLVQLIESGRVLYECKVGRA